MANLPITASDVPEPVGHGGDLGEIRRRFPQAPQPWIDLSTGINPLAYPLGGLSDEIWQRLPTREAEQALLAAAQHRYGVADVATIVAAPGTQALIQLLPRLMAKSRVAVLGRTYGEHALCWRRAGHDVIVVADLAGAAGADVVVLVNPDNPTGRLCPPSGLRGVRASLLVVDEAFIDLLPTGVTLARDPPPNAIVLRSFGKAYGLAGVRLGFAIAPLALAASIRRELGPWAVSGPALEIGRRALDDEGWLQAAAKRLAESGETLDRLLRAAGFAIEGGTPLFRLVRHGQARHLAHVLGEHGIHVRSFADRPTSLRLGMPADENAFRRLAEAFQVPQKVR
jgi:cobalamin biosynthetic protein CobC